SGFTHTAFALGYEAGLNKSTIDPDLVPPGALVTFVQKGIMYLELEANLSDDELDTDEDFQFLNPLDLITKNVDELQRIVKEKKEKEKSTKKENINVEDDGPEMVKGKIKQQRGRDRGRVEKEKEIGKGKEKEKLLRDNPDANFVAEEVKAGIDDKRGDEAGAEPMDICVPEDPLAREIPKSDVTVLQGHSSEVFACAWNPAGSLLASGSGDATARIWTIGEKSSSSAQNGPSSVVLRHFKGRINEKSKDVTTLDWNVEGSLLATGSYDGQARIWSKDGELISNLNKHIGPIFSLKWNKKGDFLLSGSFDKTAIVWDVKAAECKQQFEFHTAPALDVDWRNNVSFATCSTDNMIYVCKVGESRPVKTFVGHKGEVNAIKWDPTSTLLASCSDDSTAKIWTLKQDACLLDLREHSKEIYTIRWSPPTNNPGPQLVLASASFDSTIKIWDIDAGRLLQTLAGHSDPVYSVAFSPNGEYLASGSLDKCMHIWSVKEARIVKTYTGNGGIFEVCWNDRGDRIAACFANNVVCVVDFRM
ncbi:hypothetical protein M569_14708, partial [Genlisea aurea]